MWATNIYSSPSASTDRFLARAVLMGPLSPSPKFRHGWPNEERDRPAVTECSVTPHTQQLLHVKPGGFTMPNLAVEDTLILEHARRWLPHGAAASRTCRWNLAAPLAQYRARPDAVLHRPTAGTLSDDLRDRRSNLSNRRRASRAADHTSTPLHRLKPFQAGSRRKG